MNRLAAILFLTRAVAACGNQESVAPAVTAPSPPTPSLNGRALIKGVVSDTGFRHLAGARVEVVDGPEAGTSTTTDANGGFSLNGAFDPSDSFRATKEGYVAATQVSRTYPNASTGYLTFSLEVLTPPVNMAGDYTLTFVADSACAANLPNEVRTRTYAATITPWSSTSFNVEVSGASFLYNSFPIGVAGDYLGFWLGDPPLVDEVTENTYLEFLGEAAASVGTSGVSTISASFDGVIDYCVLKSEVGQYYACPREAVAHAQCESKNHQLILTRR